MEHVHDFFKSIGRVIPVVIFAVLTSLGTIFLDFKRSQKSQILEVERTYFDLSSEELLKIYMDISQLLASTERLTKAELKELYFIMENYRIWCLDLHDFDAKYHCGSSIYYHLHLFRVQYKDKIDTNHSLEYVELNVLNITSRIKKLKGQIA